MNNQTQAQNQTDATATPTFTDDQQSYIDSIIQKRLGQATAKHQTEKAELEARLTELQQQRQESLPVDEALAEARAERDRAAEELRTIKLEAETGKMRSYTRKALRQNGFREELIDSLSALVEMDANGRYVPRDPATGKPAVDASGLPMSVQEWARSMVKNHGYMTGSGEAGPGSRRTGSNFTGTPKTKADFGTGLKGSAAKAEFIQKHGYDAWERLPLGDAKTAGNKSKTFRG